MKVNHKFVSQNYATIMGVLIVAGVFALAIGTALFIQNGESLRQVWPFMYVSK